MKGNGSYRNIVDINEGKNGRICLYNREKNEISKEEEEYYDFFPSILKYTQRIGNEVRVRGREGYDCEMESSRREEEEGEEGREGEGEETEGRGRDRKKRKRKGRSLRPVVVTSLQAFLPSPFSLSHL